MITREPEFHPPPKNVFGGMGRAIIELLRGAGRSLMLLGEALLFLPHSLSKRSRHEVFYQLFVTGIKSLGVITIVALFTGMVMTLQTGIELKRFSQENTIGTAVTVVMMREMGPFMTALIIAASVGSAIAAQLGTMTVSEEVAALEIMSINPVRFLVMPRLLALMIMLPLLTIYTNTLGILGGAVVAKSQLDVDWFLYFDSVRLYATNMDHFIGLLKAFIFGIIIATVSCSQGFAARGGAVGVGLATRRSVIISFLMILVVGYIITGLFYG